MTRLAAALVGLMMIASGATAQSDGPADAIRQVITKQLLAFQADDFETAFTFASPTIQGIFQNPERFGAMVRNGYPMVWRPADVQFGGLDSRGGRQVQTVFLTGQDGRLYEAVYEMVLTGDGWEINGVAIRPADLGA